jgi:hypothetical protein
MNAPEYRRNAIRRSFGGYDRAGQVFVLPPWLV